MTTEQRLERDLPSYLGDIAMGAYPDYIDDVLSVTAQKRQRPGWTFPERWVPMDTTTSRVPVARLPWRQLGVLALLLIFVAGAVAVNVGSQRQTVLPPPFGRAANGNVMYAKAGDIYVADPVTGVEKAIVTGPDADGGPVWSLDGTRVAFERGADRLFVVNADGQGLTQLTPTPVRALDSWSFSPDGRSIAAFAIGDDGRSIMVVPSDGSAAPKLFPAPWTSDDGPPKYRPDGSEIMFIGQGPGAPSRAVFALDPATGQTRTVIAAPVSRDISGATWSPDGSKISYNMHDTTAEGHSNRVYVASSDGSAEVAVDTDPGTTADGGGLWSNDGTRLIIQRLYGNPERATTAIIPVDRSDTGIELQCPPAAPANDCTADWIWSPDDTMLIGSREGTGPQFLADPLTGKIRPAPWTASGVPDVQRRAP